MPKIRFANLKLRRSSLSVIAQANAIIAEFAAMGFTLTLRQLYYQFIGLDAFPEDRRWRWTGSRWVRDPNGTKNALPNYKWLGVLVSDGRMAGLIDWNAIEDRVRTLQQFSTWDSPQSILETCASQFKFDLWEDQDNYVEVWVEKDALIGVVGVPCNKWRVPHFACKGYTSQSGIWEAGYNRLRRQARKGKTITILHLGDHDPSGIDMTRDIRDRLELFAGRPIDIVRLALNMDQVESLNLPPSPAKTTDSRFEGYMQEFGEESWELDALSPNVIAELIEREVEERLDMDAWEAASAREEGAKETLQLIADRYEDVAEYVKDTDE